VTFSPDGGMLAVEAAAQTELGKNVIKIHSERDAALVSERLKALLDKPLTASAAVQIALLNNRAMQAAYNELGISEAEMVEASLPPAPTFTFLRIVGSGFEIERHIIENVLALITLPRRREIAEAQFSQAQVRAIEGTLRAGADAARAYYRAVAASETVKIVEELRLSAEAVSDLAKQLGETGAMSKLDQAREQVFYAEVSGQLATARLRQRIERERLIRVLGLWGADTHFTLASGLPALPAKPKTLASIESEAVSRRADLVIARMELDILALRLGLTRKNRFINTLEVTGVSKVDKDVITNSRPVEVDKFDRRGFQVDLQVPIYDFGEARVRRAEETYIRAVNRLLDLAVTVRSEAREAYQIYRGTYDVARHYEREVLPLRKIIADETLLNYNAMIRDPIALLSDARARLLSNVQAVEARRDFWLATVDLHAAIVGGRETRETTEPGQTLRAAGSDSTLD
jgi:outer membrane protein TolC